MTTEPADTLLLASQPADSSATLNAELLGALHLTAAQIHTLTRASQVQPILSLLQVTADGPISKIKQSLQP